MFRKTLSFTLAMGMVSSATLPAFAGNDGIVKVSQAEKNAALKSSLTTSQQLAIKLLIANALVTRKIGKVVEVDPNIQKNYGRVRGMILGSIPASSVTGIAGYLGKESAEEFKSILTPVTELVKFLGTMSYESAKASWELIEKIGLNIILEKSGKSIEWSFKNIIEPIVKSSITKGSAVASGAVTAAGLAATSSFLLFNPTAEGALSFDVIRQVLGYNQNVEKNIDLMIEQVSAVFDLNATDKANLKLAIVEETLKQAVENEFSSDSSRYKLDIVKIMKDKKIITEEVADVVSSLRTAYERTTSTDRTTVSDVEMLKSNLNAVLALHAMLATTVESGSITDEAMREKMQQLLGGVSARLMLLGFNLN